jgi:hypothetical protein
VSEDRAAARISPRMIAGGRRAHHLCALYIGSMERLSAAAIMESSRNGSSLSSRVSIHGRASLAWSADSFELNVEVSTSQYDPLAASNYTSVILPQDRIHFDSWSSSIMG